MEIYSNNEERKKKKRQEAEEQISCWTAEFANQISQILFLYLYIWILSVAVEISTQDLISVT